MRTTLEISIPKPCHENWDHMFPKDKGRHCLVCEKTVHDFTNQTDEQIIKIFQKENGLCGRFKSTQLNRELVLSRKKKNNYVSFLASTFFTFLSFNSQDMNAQGKPKIVKVDSSFSSALEGKIGMSVLNERIVSGKVLSAEDGSPMPGASIIIKGTKRGAQTDFDGNYKIKIKADVTLIFKYVGKKTAEYVLKNQSRIDVWLEDDPNACLEVIVGAPSTNYYSPHKIAERKARREKIKNGQIKRTAVGKYLFSITNIFRKKD